MTEIRDIQHVSLLVSDTRRALAFYQGVLGLALDPNRPELGFPGAWLQVGARQIHLLELPSPNPDPVADRRRQAGHVGRDRHVALAVTSLESLERALDRAGVDYTRSRSGRRALFCRDPDGNGLEFIEQGPPD